MSEEKTDHGSRPAPDATMMAMAPVENESPSEHARASLIVVAGGEIGREFEVHGEGQILGRSLQAHIVVNAPSVSRQHARLDRHEEDGGRRYEVTDLGSSNGTLVNGRRVVSATIENGDKIAVGDVVLKFVIQDAVDAQFHQDVHRLIHYDQLTGLLTMEAFRARLEARIRRGSPDAPFSLAMTDLDGLKKVNDTHGHLAGRMTVREMGVILRSNVREGDLAGLYGGDEAIILFEGAALDDAAEAAEGIRRAVEQRSFEHGGQEFRVTISQGLAEWPRHGETPEALIAAADRALYAAKAAGRNRVARYDRLAG